MKKLVIGISIFLVGLVAILVTGLFLVGKVVTPEFLVSTIESSINVRANVEKININLLSLFSSIEVEGIGLGKRDEVANKGIPLAERQDKFSPVLGLGKVELKLSIGPLLSGKFSLQKLLLIEPKVNLVLFSDGGNNLTPFFKPPLVVNGQPNPALSPEALAERKKEEEEAKSEVEEPSKPFHIRDLPVAIQVGTVGVKNGSVTVLMKKSGQTIYLNSLDFIISDLDIDGKDLASHNKLDLDLDVNLLIKDKTGKDSTELLLETSGTINPFVVATGAINPSVEYKITMLKGSFLSGLAAFDAASGEMPMMKSAGLKMDKLNEKATLEKDVQFKVKYGNGRVTFLDSPTFPSKNYDLTIQKESYIQLTDNTHEWKLGVLYEKEESTKSISNVDKQIQDATKGQGDPKEIRNKLLGNLVQDGRIQLPMKTYGDIRNPSVELGVQLGSLTDLIGGAVSGAIKGKVGEELKKIPGSDALKKLF